MKTERKTHTEPTRSEQHPLDAPIPRDIKLPEPMTPLREFQPTLKHPLVEDSFHLEEGKLPTVSTKPTIWANPQNGWEERSYKGLSNGEKLKYWLGSAGNKIRSIWNALGQLLSRRGNASKVFFQNMQNVDEKKQAIKEGIEEEDIQKQLKQRPELRRNKTAPTVQGVDIDPSKTVEKLLDEKGPRLARLSPSDLTHVVNALIDPTKAKVIDGYGMVGGVGFASIKNRIPSEVLLKEHFNQDINKLLLMPFSFPANKGSEEHVVLITLDPTRKEIRYFDPKGLHSDDSTRLGGFTDDPVFNLRSDLETLQNKLGKDWKIKENTKAYQLDPTNCGTYVALAMQDEAQGKQVGKDWQSGPAWVNARKPELAKKVWEYYEEKHPVKSEQSKGGVKPHEEKILDFEMDDEKSPLLTKSVSIKQPEQQVNLQETNKPKPISELPPTTKSRIPGYNWSLEGHRTWDSILKPMSDQEVIGYAAKILAERTGLSVENVMGQFENNRLFAEDFLRENMPEPLRFGALGDKTKTSKDMKGEFHGVPIEWALRDFQLKGYGAREIVGDGSCWLTSGLYATLSQGLKNEESAKLFLKKLGDAAELLGSDVVQSAKDPRIVNSPLAARELTEKVQALVRELYLLKSSEGDLPESVKERLSEDDQGILLSLGKNAWRAWMSQPENMALLRDFSSQVMAAKKLQNLSEEVIQLNDSNNYLAVLTKQGIDEILTPREEQGPEALSGLAELTGIELPYLSYDSKKPQLQPVTGSLLPGETRTLSDFAKSGTPILLYGPYGKDGTGGMHYSVLEPSD